MFSYKKNISEYGTTFEIGWTDTDQYVTDAYYISENSVTYLRISKKRVTCKYNRRRYFHCMSTTSEDCTGPRLYRQ